MIFWLGVLLLTVTVLAPLLLVILGRPTLRGRRDPALALHRAQLLELDRELAEGRLLPAEHAAARLEVQRRLLAEAETKEPAPARTSRWPIIYCMTLAPAAAIGLYLLSQGQPGLPAQPLAPRQAEWALEDSLIDQLKARLAALPPGDARLYEGYLLLADSEAKRNRLDQASNAWVKSLAIYFDPGVAARAAEARSESLGQVDGIAADLFKRALAAAPADAEWKDLAEERLKEAAK